MNVSTTPFYLLIVWLSPELTFNIIWLCIAIAVDVVTSANQRRQINSRN